MATEPEGDRTTSEKGFWSQLLSAFRRCYSFARRLLREEYGSVSNQDRRETRFRLWVICVLFILLCIGLCDFLMALAGIAFLDALVLVDVRQVESEEIRGQLAGMVPAVVGGGIALYSFVATQREKVDSLAKTLDKDRAIAHQTDQREQSHEAKRHINDLRARWETTIESTLMSAVQGLHSEQESVVQSSIHTIADLATSSSKFGEKAEVFTDLYPFYERCLNRLIDSQIFLPTRSLLDQCSRSICQLIQFGSDRKMPLDNSYRCLRRLLDANAEITETLCDYVACFWWAARIRKSGADFESWNQWDDAYDQFIAEIDHGVESMDVDNEMQDVALHFGVEDVSGRISRGVLEICSPKSAWRPVFQLRNSTEQVRELFRYFESDPIDFLVSFVNPRTRHCLVGKALSDLKLMSHFGQHLLILSCNFTAHELIPAPIGTVRFVQCSISSQAISGVYYSSVSFSCCQFFDIDFSNARMIRTYFVSCKMEQVKFSDSSFTDCYFYSIQFGKCNLDRSHFCDCSFSECSTFDECSVMDSKFRPCNISGMTSEMLKYIQMPLQCDTQYSIFTHFRLLKTIPFQGESLDWFQLDTETDQVCADAFSKLRSG